MKRNQPDTFRKLEADKILKSVWTDRQYEPRLRLVFSIFTNLQRMFLSIVNIPKQPYFGFPIKTVWLFPPGTSKRMKGISLGLLPLNTTSESVTRNLKGDSNKYIFSFLPYYMVFSCSRLLQTLLRWQSNLISRCRYRGRYQV